MPMKGAALRRRRTSSILALIVLTILGAAAAGWSLFWYAAARQTDAVVTAWIAREATLGRVWSCPQRHIGGYPLDIEMSCAGLQFRGKLVGGDFTGSLHGFRASSSVLRPERLTAQLESPFTGKTPDGKLDLALQWAKLDLTIEGPPDALTRFSLEGDQMLLKGSMIGVGALNSGAKTVQVSITPRPDGEAALNFDIAMNGVAIPSMSDVLGLDAPLDAILAGTVTKIDSSTAGTLFEDMERWREKGGRLDVRTALLTSGSAKLDARGSLDLDEAHRPRGKLDTAFEGLNPVLGRLGVDPRVLTASSLLTNFLGHAQGKQQAEAARLPLRIADGWLLIGPIRTPVRLPALY
ncbi:conserved hypothetical protein [Methylocella tundrae]|uniref:DUF2125 domain-containing protein n=1 Tax=Methylocella tundrae TaxID=227605 RepID=A0A8B6M2U4_METTU|nr:DUF2125 domain-containing protein [Methylocella tundrae]VTZ48570.1 conserved hypothetical protein [Methylocella tundrae]